MAEEVVLETIPHSQLANRVGQLMTKYAHIKLPDDTTAGINKILFINLGANLEILTLLHQFSQTVNL